MKRTGHEAYGCLNMILAAVAIIALLALAASAFAQAPPVHDGHDWLQHKMTPGGQPCCKGGQNGDCPPVPFDSYTQDSKGGVHYGKYYFSPDRVFPTEDHMGRPFMCIYADQPRCAFIPSGV